MKRMIIALIAATPLLVMSTSVSADNKGKYSKKKRDHKAPVVQPHSVPEIDAAGAALALSLLAGIAAIRRERKQISAQK
jgi:MYXO-CTERM domain-containing protein